MDLATSKQRFMELTTCVKPQVLTDFLKWIQEAEQFKCQESAEIILENISEEIRNLVPFEAILPSENIAPPSVGKNADCEDEITAHVDSFLYPDDYLDELVEAGKFSRNYCVSCGSRDTKPLTFVSHSASKPTLKLLFKQILPDISKKTLVDVGSRLGPVLYAAHLFTSCQKIIGIEINKELCDVQQKILDKFMMNDRTSVMNADVLECGNVLVSADVIIMNNVFEFFADEKQVTKLWQFMMKTIRGPEKLLVTIPSLRESLEPLKMVHLIDGWVEEVASRYDVENYDYDDVHLYKLR